MFLIKGHKITFIDTIYSSLDLSNFKLQKAAKSLMLNAIARYFLMLLIWIRSFPKIIKPFTCIKITINVVKEHLVNKE